MLAALSRMLRARMLEANCRMLTAKCRMFLAISSRMLTAKCRIFLAINSRMLAAECRMLAAKSRIVFNPMLFTSYVHLEDGVVKRAIISSQDNYIN
jgi:hypothetical protein